MYWACTLSATHAYYTWIFTHEMHLLGIHLYYKRSSTYVIHVWATICVKLPNVPYVHYILIHTCTTYMVFCCITHVIDTSAIYV